MKREELKPFSCVQTTLSSWTSGPVGSGLGSALDWWLSFEPFLLLHPMLMAASMHCSCFPLPRPSFSWSPFHILFSSNASLNHAFFLGSSVTTLATLSLEFPMALTECAKHTALKDAPTWHSKFTALTASLQGSHVCNAH